MKVQRKTNFQGICSFNCAISNFFGYFHFPPNQNHVKYDECKATVYTKFAFHVAFGLFASIKSSNINVGHVTSSIIVNIAIGILIKLTLFMPTVYRVFNFVVRHEHVKIIKNVQSIDDELFRMGININYLKHFVVAVLVTLIYFSFLFITFYVDSQLTLKYLNLNLDPIVGLCAAFNVAAYLSYQISHMLIITTVYKRLQQMNHILETKRLDHSLLRKVGKLSNKLSDTLEMINSCYSINLLNYFLQFIIFSIFFFFGLFHYLTSPEADFQEFIFNTISCFYLFYFFWFGAWMITFSSWVESEGHQTIMLIHSHTLTSQKDLTACNCLCLQLDHQKPLVSCGLFIVDWAYLLVFISALFSYLIILVQFETG